MSKDYFGDDILRDAISTQQQERNEKRQKLREKRLRDAEKAKVAAENRRTRGKVLLVIAVVGAVLVFMFGRSVYQITQLQKEKDAQAAKLAELQYNIDRLNEELTRVTSDEYIEQQARKQLRMIYPGELLYIVNPKQ
ncbi:MAG: septum formation initiator family protein [Clostridia bacterium]|nr:septum formation initiator family protein [Clostridia bacterium]